MKRSKLYFQIGIAVVLTIICVLFSGGTTYFLYKNNPGTAGVFATLIGIPLTIVVALWTYVSEKSKKNTLINSYISGLYRKLIDLIEQTGRTINNISVIFAKEDKEDVAVIEGKN